MEGKNKTPDGDGKEEGEEDEEENEEPGSEQADVGDGAAGDGGMEKVGLGGEEEAQVLKGFPKLQWDLYKNV